MTSPTVPQPVSRSLAGGERAMRLLLVDDDPAELRLLLDALRAAHFDLSVALTGLQGYGRAVASAPDLILMDVRMDPTDGFVACRLLKADPATRHIPLIFLTASASLAERITGLDAGAADYILKPFEPAEVVARVRAQLRARQQHTVAETSATAPPAPMHAAEVMAQAAARQIEVDLTHIPSLAKLARQVGTHERGLSRAFQETMGMSVFDFVRQRRLAMVQRLLTQTPLDMADIAVETGYSSGSNLATAFRSAFGITPRDYRERQRTAHQELGELARSPTAPRGHPTTAPTETNPAAPETPR